MTKRMNWDKVRVDSCIKKCGIESFNSPSSPPILLEDILKKTQATNKVPPNIQLAARKALEHLDKHHSIQVIRNFMATLQENEIEVVASFLAKYGKVKFDANGLAQYDRTKKVPLNMAAMLDARWDRV